MKISQILNKFPPKTQETPQSIPGLIPGLRKAPNRYRDWYRDSEKPPVDTDTDTDTKYQYQNKAFRYDTDIPVCLWYENF